MATSTTTAGQGHQGQREDLLTSNVGRPRRQRTANSGENCADRTPCQLKPVSHRQNCQREAASRSKDSSGPLPCCCQASAQRSRQPSGKAADMEACFDGRRLTKLAFSHVPDAFLACNTSRMR